MAFRACGREDGKSKRCREGSESDAMYDITSTSQCSHSTSTNEKERDDVREKDMWDNEATQSSKLRHSPCQSSLGGNTLIVLSVT